MVEGEEAVGPLHSAQPGGVLGSADAAQQQLLYLCSSRACNPAADLAQQRAQGKNTKVWSSVVMQMLDPSLLIQCPVVLTVGLLSICRHSWCTLGGPCLRLLADGHFLSMPNQDVYVCSRYS